MGTYRQWLQYREAEQQLRRQLTALEEELRQLQERAGVLEGAGPTLDNTLLAALVQYEERLDPAMRASGVGAAGWSLLRPPDSSRAAEKVRSELNAQGTGARANTGKDADERAGIMSPALLAWGQLPTFGSVEAPVEQEQAEGLPSVISRSSLFTASEAAAMLPDVAMEGTRPGEQIAASEGRDEERVDAESARTDQRVERWKLRWGRLAQAGEDEGEGNAGGGSMPL